MNYNSTLDAWDQLDLNLTLGQHEAQPQQQQDGQQHHQTQPGSGQENRASEKPIKNNTQYGTYTKHQSNTFSNSAYIKLQFNKY